jgi:Divergent InlB B-repeat domain
VATPDSGYQFVNWTGNVHTIADVNAASVTITMDDDCSLVANFEAIPSTQYTLTISSTEGGGVTTPGEGTFRYAAGTVVDLVTESEEGYKFFTWTGDIATMAEFNASSSTAHVQPPRHFSITMESNYAITANFIIRWVPLDKIEPGS